MAGWLKECEMMGEFTEVHVEQFRELMGNRIFKRFIGKLIRETNEVAKQVVRMDLSEGPSRAIKLQGRYDGMLRFLGAFEEVLELEDDNADTNRHDDTDGEYDDAGHPDR